MSTASPLAGVVARSGLEPGDDGYLPIEGEHVYFFSAGAQHAQTGHVWRTGRVAHVAPRAITVTADDDGTSTRVHPNDVLPGSVLRKDMLQRIEQVAAQLEVFQTSLRHCNEKCEKINSSLTACSKANEETAASSNLRYEVVSRIENVQRKAADALSTMPSASDSESAPLREALDAAIRDAKALGTIASDDRRATPQVVGEQALQRLQAMHISCNKENAGLEENAAKVKLMLESLKSRCLHKSDSPSTDEVLNLEEDLTKLMDRIAENHGAASECASTIDSHLASAKTFTNSDGLSEHARSLQEQCAQVEQNVTSLIDTSSIVRYRTKCVELQSRVDDMLNKHSQLAQLSQEEAAALEVDLSQLKAKSAISEQGRADLEERCRQLETDLSASRKGHRDVIESLRHVEHELARKQALANATNEEKEKVEQRLAHLDAQLGERAHVAQHLEQELKGKLQEAAASEARVETLRTSEGNLRSECDALKEQLRQTLVACAGLAEDATNKGSESERMNVEIARLNEEIAALKEENANLRAQLESREYDIIRLSEELESLRLGSAAAMAELDQLRQLSWEEMGELRNENRKLRVANALLSQGDGGAIYRRWLGAELERRKLFELLQPQVRVAAIMAHMRTATQFEKGIGSILSTPDTGLGTVRVHRGEHASERSRRGTMIGEGGTAHEDFELDDVIDLDSPKHPDVWRILKPYARLLADGKSACIICLNGGAPTIQEDLLFGEIRNRKSGGGANGGSVSSSTSAPNGKEQRTESVSDQQCPLLQHFLLDFLKQRAEMTEAGWSTALTYCLLDVDADRLEDAMGGGTTSAMLHKPGGSSHISARSDIKARTRVLLRPERVEDAFKTGKPMPGRERHEAGPRHEATFVAAGGRLMPDGATWDTIESQEDAKRAAEAFWLACHTCDVDDLQRLYPDPSIRARVAQRLGTAILPRGHERAHVVLWIDFWYVFTFWGIRFCMLFLLLVLTLN